uniref:Uncharacterized protein MANES_03G109400 n=1 Tax=Rhizophora mucronata TaxID=61149 RepID=A0A2P2Q7C1_RHIMU
MGFWFLELLLCFPLMGSLTQLPTSTPQQHTNQKPPRERKA